MFVPRIGISSALAVPAPSPSAIVPCPAIPCRGLCFLSNDDQRLVLLLRGPRNRAKSAVVPEFPAAMDAKPTFFEPLPPLQRCAQAPRRRQPFPPSVAMNLLLQPLFFSNEQQITRLASR